MKISKLYRQFLLGVSLLSCPLSVSANPNFDTLPDELKLDILSRLPTKYLGTVASVSKHVKALAEDNSLWLPMFPRGGSLTANKNKQGSLKELYVKSPIFSKIENGTVLPLLARPLIGLSLNADSQDSKIGAFRIVLPKCIIEPGETLSIREITVLANVNNLIGPEGIASSDDIQGLGPVAVTDLHVRNPRKQRERK